MATGNSDENPAPREPAIPSYVEHRTVPWWWWLVATAIALPSTEAIVVLGPEMSNHPTTLLAVGCLVVTVGVVAACLLMLGRSRVRVDATGLTAGRITLPASSIGRSRALDQAASRRLLGPGLRADAKLSLRPWIKTVVQLEVHSDPATPYWVVSTRRPEELVNALEVVRRALQEATTGHGEARHDLVDPKAER